MEDLLKTRADSSPARTALIVPGQLDRPVSYCDLNSTVDTLADQLRSAGIRNGDRVGVYMENSYAAISLYFAVIRAGAAVFFHGQLPFRPFFRQLSEVGCSLIVCDGPSAERILSGDCSLPVYQAEVSGGDGPVSIFHSCGREEVPHPDPSSEPGQLLMFTSGTTGRPKPVVLSQKNLVASARASASRLGHLPTDVWYDPLPVYHMGGLSPVIRSTLYGSTVLLLSDHPEGWPVVLDTHRVTVLSLVPTMLSLAFERSNECLPDRIRFALVGGGPVCEDLLAEARRRSLPVCTTYGMTETASQIATASPGEVREHPATSGRPLQSVSVSIVDGDGRELPRGETGEIVVSGPMVTAGYFEAPERNRHVFNERGFRTGDYGYLDHANRLYIDHERSGRLVTGGETVDPKKIADVLESHPDVKEAGIVGLEDEKWGDQVSALVVLRESMEDPLHKLDLFLEEQLLPFQRPKRIQVVDHLPRTPKGVLDRSRAREILSDGGETIDSEN